MEKNINESTTVTLSLKVVLSSIAAIVLAMLGLFWIFYGFAMTDVANKHESVTNQIIELKNDLDKAKSELKDIRESQIKSGTTLELILQKTLDNVGTPNIGNTSGKSDKPMQP